MSALEKEQETLLVPQITMPIKVKPYKHQLDAFNFAMQVLGICEVQGV